MISQHRTRDISVTIRPNEDCTRFSPISRPAPFSLARFEKMSYARIFRSVLVYLILVISFRVCYAVVISSFFSSISTVSVMPIC